MRRRRRKQQTRSWMLMAQVCLALAVDECQGSLLTCQPAGPNTGRSGARHPRDPVGPVLHPTGRRPGKVLPGRRAGRRYQLARPVCWLCRKLWVVRGPRQSACYPARCGWRLRPPREKNAAGGNQPGHPVRQSPGTASQTAVLAQRNWRSGGVQNPGWPTAVPGLQRQHQALAETGG